MLRSSRHLHRQVKPVIAKAQFRQTASKAFVAWAVEDPSSSYRRAVFIGSLVAAVSAAGFLTYDQQQKKKTDCCGIIGVVAHPKFDVR